MKTIILHKTKRIREQVHIRYNVLIFVFNEFCTLCSLFRIYKIKHWNHCNFLSPNNVFGCYFSLIFCFFFASVASAFKRPVNRARFYWYRCNTEDNCNRKHGKALFFEQSAILAKHLLWASKLKKYTRRIETNGKKYILPIQKIHLRKCLCPYVEVIPNKRHNYRIPNRISK